MLLGLLIYVKYFQDLLGITNGVDTISFDGDCDDDDITEPIAPCTSQSPTLLTNGVKNLGKPSIPSRNSGSSASSKSDLVHKVHTRLGNCYTVG